MRIFLSAGEASGDAYGAALVREIRSRNSEVAFEGIGGPKLRAEGVKLYADSSHWGAISIVQALKVGFGVLYRMYGIRKYLRYGKPGLLVAIDFGFANIRLCRYAKKHGWKVLYFVPPGSWRRDRQGKDLPGITDAIVTPFKWSAAMLNRMGANSHWFGHPIKQLIEESSGASRREEGVGGGQGSGASNADLLEVIEPTIVKRESLSHSIAVLPGSRKHELEMNLPVIAEATKGLDNHLEFALAPSVNLEDFRREWNRLAPDRNDVFTVGDTYGVLRRARAGIICSGTATLEAALCRCPMVVLYKLSPGMVREAKLIRMKRPKFISLPNILMDREIVPEIAGEDVRPEQVRAQLDSILFGEEARARQLADFEELDRILGPSDAITKTAELAIRLATS